MLSQLSIKMRFMIIVTALISGFSMFGIWTFYAVKTLNVNGPVYQRIVQGKDLIADVLPPPEYILESYLVILQLNAAADTKETENLIARLAVLKDEFDTRHSYWLEQSLESELKNTLLEQSFTPAQQFYQEASEHFIPAVKSNNLSAKQASLDLMQSLYEQHRQAINAVVKLTTTRNQQDEQQAATKINWNTQGLISIFCFSVLIALLLTWKISSCIIRQLGGEPAYAASIAQNIANGQLDNEISLKSDDQSSLLANMQNMQQQLLARITQEAVEKANALRIQKALDKANSKVMMLDREYNIIYTNEALLELFEQIQSDIRTSLPDFKADALMGASIDLFFTQAQDQRRTLDTLTSAAQANLLIGSRHLSYISNPVIDEHGQRLGMVFEWMDRTAEVRIENEIQTIVEAVKVGDLQGRINTVDKNGFFFTLSVGINELTQTIEMVFNDVATVMQSLSSGDLTHSMTNQYDGIYAQCQQDINATIKVLGEIFQQIKQSSDFISSSSQEIASGNNNLSQRAEEQAASLEQTASSMEELTSTVQNNADNAKQANSVATEAKYLAEKGGAIVSSAVQAMQEINDSSARIAEMIGVIDEIAFQTNLLALNASVEAARAGDQGLGFAVVATEVRNLAQRSANAARESKTLIQNSLQKVRSGTEYVNETGRSLKDIVAGVQKVSAIIAEIASASKEQTAGIVQVNQAVTQMDEITQQNAALAEQAAAASISMNEQSSQMANLLAFFQIESNPTIKSNKTTNLERPETRMNGTDQQETKETEELTWEDF